MINYFGDERLSTSHHQWNKLPGTNQLRSRVFASPYRSLVLPDGQDAWMRVDDGFISSDTPFECVPRDIEYPHDRSGIWEEKANEYDAWTLLRQQMIQCWYHHLFMITKMQW
eukprot:2151781-Amphidinium_carterae.1